MYKLLVSLAVTSFFSLPAFADSPEVLIDEANSLVLTGFEMAELSASSRSEDVAQCMAMMDEHQPQSEALRTRIAALPYSVSKSNLDMAAIDLRRCLSCVPDALSSCEAAEKLIDTAEQYL